MPAGSYRSLGQCTMTSTLGRPSVYMFIHMSTYRSVTRVYVQAEVQDVGEYNFTCVREIEAGIEKCAEISFLLVQQNHNYLGSHNYFKGPCPLLDGVNHPPTATPHCCRLVPPHAYYCHILLCPAAKPILAPA